MLTHELHEAATMLFRGRLDDPFIDLIEVDGMCVEVLTSCGTVLRRAEVHPGHSAILQRMAEDKIFDT